MTIQDIYTKYQIMPNLQLHMYRVTAVAQQICDASPLPLDKENILAACLLHDMGNIIKFDLQRFPEFLQPKGVAFWQEVQAEVIARYGLDEHAAASKIAEEVGVPERVRDLIESIGFVQIHTGVAGDDLGVKICEYADDRVTPFGVVSLEERLADLENRYAGRYPSAEDQEKRRQFGELARQLEKQVFAQSTITPEDITDLSVNTRLENLQKFEIIGAT